MLPFAVSAEHHIWSEERCGVLVWLLSRRRWSERISTFFERLGPSRHNDSFGRAPKFYQTDKNTEEHGMVWYGIIIATRFNSMSLFLESFGGNHQIPDDDAEGKRLFRLKRRQSNCMQVKSARHGRWYTWTYCCCWFGWIMTNNSAGWDLGSLARWAISISGQPEGSGQSIPSIILEKWILLPIRASLLVSPSESSYCWRER